MRKNIALGLAAGALVVLPLIAGTAHAAVSSRACGEATYSYAGIVGRRATRGIMATVESTVGPTIAHGHVAAWVGVGGVGLGPGGTNEWLQAGLAATESTSTTVYYELAQPGRSPRFVALRGVVAVGERHRVGVVEMAHRPNWWRVWLDGRAVTRPIELRTSHDRWAPVATSESWNGGVPSCNGFGYRFRNIRWSLNTENDWRPFLNAYPIHAPGYAVRRTAVAGLVLSGGEPQPVAATTAPPAPTPPIN